MLLCYETYSSGYLGVGWGGENFWGGGIRIFYSFLAGMLIFRLNWMIKTKLGFLPLGILLMLAFLIPFIDSWNYFADPLVVIFYFPILIMLGAGTHLTDGLTRICKFLGDISYPLYIIHYPFMWVFLSYIELQKPSIQTMAATIPIGVIFLICLTYLTMRFLDTPGRNYLKRKVRNEIKAFILEK